jgi:hypothetical protein
MKTKAFSLSVMLAGLLAVAGTDPLTIYPP